MFWHFDTSNWDRDAFRSDSCTDLCVIFRRSSSDQWATWLRCNSLGIPAKNASGFFLRHPIWSWILLTSLVGSARNGMLTLRPFSSVIDSNPARNSSRKLLSNASPPPTESRPGLASLLRVDRPGLFDLKDRALKNLKGVGKDSSYLKLLVDCAGELSRDRPPASDPSSISRRRAFSSRNRCQSSTASLYSGLFF